jgi:hypothetical protein
MTRQPWCGLMRSFGLTTVTLSSSRQLRALGPLFLPLPVLNPDAEF